MTMKPQVKMSNIQLDSKFLINLQDKSNDVIKRKSMRSYLTAQSLKQELRGDDNSSQSSEDEVDEMLINHNLTPFEVRKFFAAVKGDKTRYIQILLNFLSNSMKFSSNGKKVKMVATIIDVQQSQEHDLINSYVASQHSLLEGSEEISVDME